MKRSLYLNALTLILFGSLVSLTSTARADDAVKDDTQAIQKDKQDIRQDERKIDRQQKDVGADKEKIKDEKGDVRKDRKKLAQLRKKRSHDKAVAAPAK